MSLSRAGAVGHNACLDCSVSTNPGQRQFTWRLRGPHSTASVFVMAITPAFAAAECTVPGPPTQA
jgi:hypothetical protein